MSDIVFTIVALTDTYYTLPWLGTIPLGKILLSIGLFLATNLIFWLLRRIILVRLRSWSRYTRTGLDDALISAIQGIRVWVYSIVSLYAAVHVFSWSPTTEKVFLGIFLFAVMWQAIEIVICFIDYVVKRYAEKGTKGELDANAATMSDMVRLLSRIILWVLGGLFVISNLGIEVTSLLAGLGIGGIAVAFALQGILSDLFASFSIYFDRPFRIGDFITVGSNAGTVEKIGIKSTRIRTLQGEELVISNAELTGARVQNFKKMQDRRIAVEIGVAYETDQDSVEKIPDMIKEIFARIEHTRLDRAHFKSFGDFGLIFEIVYYVESSDYSVYMDAQQEFNLSLMRAFAAAGIQFARPAQIIYTRTDT